MNVFEAIEKLEKVKEFDDKEIDDKIVGVLLYAGSQSISAGNVQEIEFIVVKDDEKKKMLYEASLNQEWVLKAPLNIVVCADLKKISAKYGVRGEVLYSIEDASFAALAIALQAIELGLATYIVQTFDEESVRIALRLPENIRPILIISIGYPKKKVEKERLNFEQISWLDEYGKKIELSYAFQPDRKMNYALLQDILLPKEKRKKLSEKIKEIVRKIKRKS